MFQNTHHFNSDSLSSVCNKHVISSGSYRCASRDGPDSSSGTPDSRDTPGSPACRTSDSACSTPDTPFPRSNSSSTNDTRAPAACSPDSRPFRTRYGGTHRRSSASPACGTSGSAGTTCRPPSPPCADTLRSSLLRCSGGKTPDGTSDSAPLSARRAAERLQ